jgi:hypothetical protein
MNMEIRLCLFNPALTDVNQPRATKYNAHPETGLCETKQW